VERLINKNWQVVLTDGDPETMYLWERVDIAESLVTVQWNIPNDVVTGAYRITTFGTSKSIWGDYTSYNGTSSTFQVE